MTLRQLINAVMETGNINKVTSIIYDTYYQETDDRQVCDQMYIGVVRELIEIDGDDQLSVNHDMLIHEHTSMTTNKQPDGFVEKYVDVCLTEHDSNETFAIDMIKWSQVIDMNINNKDNFSMFDQLAHVLWELTFHGFTSEQVDHERDKLKQLCDRIDNGQEKLIPFDLSTDSIDPD